MDTETFLIVFAFLWGGWILFKIHRKRGGRRSIAEPKDVAKPRPAEPPADRAMPRVGKPGTITFNQMQELRHNNFTPDKNWSLEEAALILDAVAYMRAVCRNIADDADGPPPLEVQNDLLRFILTNQDIRDHVRVWGERCRQGEENGDKIPEPARNRQYDRVAEQARGHLTP